MNVSTSNFIPDSMMSDVYMFSTAMLVVFETQINDTQVMDEYELLEIFNDTEKFLEQLP